MSSKAPALPKDFSHLHLLVVGDLMLDRYVWGDVERISPEAPVPVLQVRDEDQRLGGAANVANNLKELGASVAVVGVVGNDAAGESIRNMLMAQGMQAKLIIDEERPTTVKTRVIAQGQQVVRVDREYRGSLDRATKSALKAAIDSLGRSADGIIVSDYAKGVISMDVVELLSSMSLQKQIELIIDPKPVNVRCYKGASVITPNEQEAHAMIGSHGREEPEALARKLHDKLGVQNILITRGAAGMYAWHRDQGAREIRSEAREVYDVTGAGDTVVAVLAAALAGGATFFEAASLANVAAGLVVAKVGTASVSVNELSEALSKKTGRVNEHA